MNDLEIIVSLLRDILENCGGSSVDPQQVTALIKQYVGDKTTLTTRDKSNIVKAINELVADEGLEGSEEAGSTTDAGYIKTEAGYVDYDATKGYSIGTVGNALNQLIWSKSVYGVRHYYNNASAILTRIGNTDLHKNLPVQSLMKRCILNDEGEVVTYLSASDSTKNIYGEDAVLDGTQGQVMVEIPAHYRKFTLNTDEGYYDCEISLLPFEGAHKVNKCYISAYEASLDRSTNKLSSVVNTTTNYRGGNNTTAWDDTYRSLLGKPVTNTSLTTFRTYANNRGSLWKSQEWSIYCAVYWLYTVEYANLNCQDAYNANLTTEGYKQGGLGAGVTAISDWNGYNGYNPIIPCGATNSLGNKTGIVIYNVLASDGTSTYYAASVPSYRGVENLFGHIWKWTDGVLGLGNGTTQDYYKCSLRNKYSSSVTSDYVKVGTSPTATNGWMKEILRNEEGDIMCKAVGGGDRTYFCDYHYNANSNGSTYGFLLGGAAHDGALAGFGYSFSVAAPSYSFADFGSRLCYCKEDKIIN